MKFRFCLERRRRSGKLNSPIRLARHVGLRFDGGGDLRKINRLEGEIDIEEWIRAERLKPARGAPNLFEGERNEKVSLQPWPAIQAEAEVLHLEIVLRHSDKGGQVCALIPKMQLPEEGIV